jgi:hypothetical protein
MTERRFSDDEVARIFAKATEIQKDESRALVRTEGMSLAELQAIGKEAGIDAALIAQAARAVDQPAQPNVPAVIGIPIGVARTVKLDRRLTDDEWEALVIRCRDIFEARGKVESHGSFRQWTNGNLQILLEPAGDSHRLRLKTTRGETRGMVAAGASMLAAATIVAAVGSATGSMSLAETIVSSMPVALGGVGMLLGGLVRLPSWRRKRDEQFETIAAELLALTDKT